MTAYPSAIPESTAAEQRAHEPSMEEILASIRKIISEDQAGVLSARPEPRSLRPEDRPPVSRESEIERMRPPSARPPVDFSNSFQAAPPSAIRPEPRRTFPERAVPERPVADVREIGSRPLAPAPRLVTMREDEPLVSDQTDMAVNSAFQMLSAARAMPSPQGMEALARDLLRPMLKDWLDDNLPSLVERLVRAEIERVSRNR